MSRTSRLVEKEKQANGLLDIASNSLATLWSKSAVQSESQSEVIGLNIMKRHSDSKYDLVSGSSSETVQSP